jgi:transitional endoplasmic reticulum ATPase
LAQTLLSMGYFVDAEKEFRQSLVQAPDDLALKLGLARVFAAQGKNSAALAIVETLPAERASTPEIHLLYARLLCIAKDMDKAAREYRAAVEANPSLADPVLAEQIGEPAVPKGEEYDDWKESVETAGPRRLRAGYDEEPQSADIEIERPRISFADVGGMEIVKEEIRLKIIHPLKHPQLYQAYGKAVGGGILMYGPPGCGKTFLARATAGEVKAGFLAVGINDVLNMWLGNSENRLHEIFENARAHGPCVLFFDEVDALGARRTDMRASAARHLVNQFLSELDGVKSMNDGVLILAATNAPWHLDVAFRRPGRFDRVLFVPPPDPPAREEIIRILLKGKPVSDIDVAYLAGKIKDFSGADLKAMIDLAVEAKLREAMQRGVPVPLHTKDLAAATKIHKPTTREWFATARNYAIYSNEGGIYDDILAYLKLL